MDVTKTRDHGWTFEVVRIVALAVPLALTALIATTGQQLVYSSGQTVAPAFEGWERNPDGSYDMVFGYFNRNLDEHLHVPIGPDNNIEPGGPGSRTADLPLPETQPVPLQGSRPSGFRRQGARVDTDHERAHLESVRDVAT